MIEIELSHEPPSVNNMFFNRPGGRTITQRYKAWRNIAGWELKLQRPTPMKGQVALQYVFGPSRADLGNLEKGVTDLLVTHGLIEGDGPKYVRTLSLAFRDEIAGVRVKVLPA